MSLINPPPDSEVFLSTFNLKPAVVIFKASKNLLNATEMTNCRIAVAIFTLKC